MDFIPPELKDLGVLRRALFASVYVPQACPNYWTVVAQFAQGNGKASEHISTSTIKVMIENLVVQHLSVMINSFVKFILYQ